MQISALTGAGVSEGNIFHEKKSGAKDDREQFLTCLDQLNAGDTLVIYKLDRLSRKSLTILETLQRIKDIGAKLLCITQPFDIDTSQGWFTATILAGVCQMERDQIIERTRHGQAEAIKRGAKIGRRTKMSEEMWNRIIELFPQHSMPKLCKIIRFEFKSEIQKTKIMVSPTNMWNHGKAIKNKTPYSEYFKTDKVKETA